MFLDTRYYDVGDKVSLRYDCGSGSLNSVFLSQHGWEPFMKVEITDWAKNLRNDWIYYGITLPSGCKIDITNYDILGENE